jgi:hypothetical protein
MRVKRYSLSEPVQHGRLNTNTVARLDDVTALSEVLGVLNELRAEYAPDRILCTLDDVNQCAYTSGHAAQGDALWLDLSDLDEDDLAAQRRATDERIAHVAAALDDPRLRVEWDALPGGRIGGTNDVAGLLAMNTAPDGILDDVVLIQRVPVPRDDLVIAGIPNGYFEDDWDTFQNHAVIRRMASHGYRHIGIGASLLGFDRELPPTAAEATAIVADLTHLYGAPDAAEWADLAAVLLTQRLLVLAYTEDFIDADDE